MGVGNTKQQQLAMYRQELKDWLVERQSEIQSWDLAAFRTALDGEQIRERLDRMIIVLEEFDRA